MRKEPIEALFGLLDTYDTDWQKAVLRSSTLQIDHNLSLSGSTDKTNYYFSMGYNKQEGVA
jgi:hypothetical protein